MIQNFKQYFFEIWKQYCEKIRRRRTFGIKKYVRLESVGFQKHVFDLFFLGGTTTFCPSRDFRRDAADLLKLFNISRFGRWNLNVISEIIV